MEATTDPKARRPIRARGSRWSAASAAWLGRRGVTPNAISLASIACAALAGAALLATRLDAAAAWADALLFVVAIVGIQGRLVCNLLDGMVAVEGGKSGPAGEIYNDFPDRVADPLVLVAAGYATVATGAEPAAVARWGVELGWLTAVLAVMTAYVRVLGRGIGGGIYFVGPMAKQHRMAVLTGACAAAAACCLVPALHRWAGAAMFAGLVVIAVGCVVTMVRRTRLISAELFRKAAAAANAAPPGEERRA